METRILLPGGGSGLHARDPEDGLVSLATPGIWPIWQAIPGQSRDQTMLVPMLVTPTRWICEPPVRVSVVEPPLVATCTSDAW